MQDKFLDKCCKNLLDFGKRNRLINYKDTKSSSVEILAPSIFDIFGNISAGTVHSFFDIDKLWGGKKPKDKSSSQWTAQGDTVDIKKISKQESIDTFVAHGKKHELLAYKQDVNVMTMLGKLRTTAQTHIKERGINVLYMTFGMLKWTEPNSANTSTGTSPTVMSSPILLLPIVFDSASGKGSKDTTQKKLAIKLQDDSIVLNPILEHKLKADLNVEIPRFGDIDGNTLGSYLLSLTDLIRDRGWSIEHNIVLGLFPFHKINMYHDLVSNQDVIRRHENYRILQNDSVASSSSRYGSMRSTKTNNTELELSNVLDADFSQMDAISFVASGRDVVIQGPPGTGKSQTITNIIAELLDQGKRVLFVSEKMAALNVVYNNLKNVGLSQFCLQLHSDTANKVEVVKELYNTMMLPKIELDDSYQDELTTLVKNKTQLDKYVDELHRPLPNINKTPYFLIGQAAKYDHYENFEYTIADIQSKDINYLDDCIQAIEQYKLHVNDIGQDYTKHGLYGLCDMQYSYDKKNKLRRTLEQLLDYAKDIKPLFRDIYDSIGLEATSIAEVDLAIDIASILCDIGLFSRNMLDVKALHTATPMLAELVDLESTLTTKRDGIERVYNKSIYSLDILEIRARYCFKYKGGLSRLGRRYKDDRFALSKNQKDINQRLSYKEQVGYLDNIVEYLELNSKYTLILDKVNSTLGVNILDGSVSNVYSKIARLYDMLSSEDSIIVATVGSCATVETIKSIVGRYNAIKTKSSIVQAMQDMFDASITTIDRLAIDSLIDRLQTLVQMQDFDEYLQSYLDFIPTLHKIQTCDIGAWIAQANSHGLDIDTWSESYKKTFYGQVLLNIFAQSDVLGTSSGITQAQAIKLFGDSDKQNIRLARGKIASKLSALRPAWQLVRGSEASIIMREVNKKRKLMPVIQLLREAKELIARLKPVFLMSPLSVATYLDSGATFDVVIFDEASQIFPWDALGAIYRAKRMVVVGDSNQMPPSNFFVAGDNEDEDDDEDVGDFESILDLCSSSYPIKQLQIHYRSKSEDLIGFSNKHFYDGNLVSFPNSYKREGDGILFEFVPDGIFDRQSKSNRIEAERVVDIIYRHFEVSPERSLGVCAFSQTQQGAIQKALEMRSKDDDKFRQYFDEDSKEPFFIKNLETIQGDERDDIIFSIGYAKDSSGKFIQNMGALNKKGGERRLNVAVTRAKYSVTVVSSIRSVDIDLSTAHSRGIRLIKEYLDIAQNGMIALPQNVAKDASGNNNELEYQVAQYIKSLGYSVDMQVGCGSYKLDMAIKHPQLDNVYVLAIECDGLNYSSVASTRYRDRLRQEVLEGLGWQFYRLWSVDWFRNISGAKRKLANVVQDAIKHYDSSNVTGVNMTSTSRQGN